MGIFLLERMNPVQKKSNGAKFGPRMKSEDPVVAMPTLFPDIPKTRRTTVRALEHQLVIDPEENM